MSVFPAFPSMPAVYPHLVASSSQATESTLCSSSSVEINPEAGSQDSDNKTAVSVTPPPTVFSSSTSGVNTTSVTTTQSVPPTVLSYFPHPWAAAYGAAVPYQISVPTAVPVTVPQTLHAGDINSITGQANHAVTWNSVCRVCMRGVSSGYLLTLTFGSRRSLTPLHICPS